MLSEKSKTGVRATIDALMEAGITSDLTGLDQIYHRDMRIVMIDPQGEASRFDKPAFMEMLQNSVSGTNPEDHRWAQYNSIEANGDKGHVAITRKVPLGGDRMILNLSIDLLFEDGRWQVVREVIFARPNPDA